MRKPVVAAAVAAVLAVLVVVTIGPAEAAAPPTPAFGPAIEGYAKYEPQRTCDPTAKPGAVEFRDLLNRTYGPHTTYIGRPCGGGTSEHYDGRALDFMLDVNNPADRAVANDLLAWLLNTDRYGHNHAMARRLGIMYVIWNRQIWGAWSPNAWQPRACDGSPSDCHTNHIHFSFGWPGAQRQTSWWWR